MLLNRLLSSIKFHIRLSCLNLVEPCQHSVISLTNHLFNLSMALCSVLSKPAITKPDDGKSAQDSGDR